MCKGAESNSIERLRQPMLIQHFPVFHSLQPEIKNDKETIITKQTNNEIFAE